MTKGGLIRGRLFCTHTTLFRRKKCVRQHFFVGKNVLFLYICMPFDGAIEEDS